MPASSEYREHPPLGRLAPFVECFWTLHVREPQPAYPVLPDGCMDIVFSDPGGLQVVGAMTRKHCYELRAGQLVCGIRFRPAMAWGFVRAPGALLADGAAPLREFWGIAAEELGRRLAESSTERERVAALESALRGSPEIGVIQRACGWAARQQGLVPIDDLARHAGLSPRQFRRLCLEQAGLTPKRLCRILRFRRAVSRIFHTRGHGAQIALECGYYDQAHFINEFREFAGSAPGQYLAARR